MTDQLAQEARANPSTRRRPLPRLPRGLPPATGQQTVDHADLANRLEVVSNHVPGAQPSQGQANQQQAGRLTNAMCKFAQAQYRFEDTVNSLNQSLQGSAPGLGRTAADTAAKAAGIGPQTTTAMGQTSGQISGADGQAVADAMAAPPPPIPPPATSTVGAVVASIVTPPKINSLRWRKGWAVMLERALASWLPCCEERCNIGLRNLLNRT